MKTMNKEIDMNEDRRQMAVDNLNAIDNGNTDSDSLIRDAMDLMSNYGYKTYDQAMERTLEKYRANPNYFSDTPNAYCYMRAKWKEMQPVVEDNDVTSAVNEVMAQMARDLAGYEPTGDSQ
tara:strand:- start:4562 stop:4924 length:363 start_codon:yes stop_codon:yes gene_type:complete